VTVNERFALFFPEKRPFFLEGIELFSTNNQLVYTRQIVDPIAGGKVTSKIGANNIALLTAVDQATSPDAWFNVARVRRDVGANSTVGVTGTSKDASGTYNRVVAGDARIVFGKLYFVAGQAGGSVDSGQCHGRLPFQPDPGGRVRPYREVLGVQLQGHGNRTLTSSLRPGFVPRNDIVQAHAFNRFSIYGSKGALPRDGKFLRGTVLHLGLRRLSAAWSPRGPLAGRGRLHTSWWLELGQPWRGGVHQFRAWGV
jgi:hypothetical protein